jgi:hypothetical protein
MKDLVFSYVFVFLSVVIGGYAVKLFYYEDIVNCLILIIACIYFFGIGCMGLKRLKLYMQDKCNVETS